MIIALGISEQEYFHRPEIPLIKTREIDIKESGNEKKTQQKSEAHNSVRHRAKLSNILGVWYLIERQMIDG